MRHVFPVISLLVILLIGTAASCLAQQVGRLRPLQRGNGTASWTQQGGVNVLELRGTTGNGLGLNIAGIVGDNVRFNSITFDLDGHVRFFVRGNFINRFGRNENGVLELNIRVLGKGYKVVDIIADDSFIFRGLLERDIQVDRGSPILISGVGRLRNIRINGRPPIISTETLTEVPQQFRGTRVKLRPLRLFR